MKYQKFLTILLFAAILLSFSTDASATWFSFDAIKMVGTNDATDPLSRVEKSLFGLNETPYLYLNLPDNTSSGFLNDFHLTGSVWTGPIDFPLPSGLEFSNSEELWLTLPYWDLVKEPGHWDVDAAFFYVDGMKGKGSTSFSVSPEPVSTVLFLAGGGILAVALRRKKKLV